MEAKSSLSRQLSKSRQSRCSCKIEAKSRQLPGKVDAAHQNRGKAEPAQQNRGSLPKSKQNRCSSRNRDKVEAAHENRGKVEAAIDTNLVKVEALEINFEAAKKQDKVSS